MLLLTYSRAKSNLVKSKAPEDNKWTSGPDGDTDVGKDVDEEDAEDDASSF